MLLQPGKDKRCVQGETLQGHLLTVCVYKM